MKTVTICGSMRFEKEMREIAWELETRQGMNVLQCVFVPASTEISAQQKEALAKAHYRKIQLSDAIYVADIGGYIGESVKREIRFAREQGKEVIFHSQYRNP